MSLTRYLDCNQWEATTQAPGEAITQAPREATTQDPGEARKPSVQNVCGISMIWCPIISFPRGSVVGVQRCTHIYKGLQRFLVLRTPGDVLLSQS